MEKCFALILSCEKYTHKRLMQDLSDFPFEYRYFIGNPDLDEPVEDNKVVYLPCPDNYESLPIKVRLGIKWIVENTTDISYIFKTDDDIIFDGGKLLKLYRDQVLKKSLDFAGNRVRVRGHWSRYHRGSCESELLNSSSLYIPATTYCSGGGYFLSAQSFNILKNSDDYKKHPFLRTFENMIFEDVIAGSILNYFSIFAAYIPIRESCIWEGDDGGAAWRGDEGASWVGDNADLDVPLWKGMYQDE